MNEPNPWSTKLLSKKDNRGFIDIDLSGIAVESQDFIDACVEVVHKLWVIGGALVLRGVSDSLRRDFENKGVAFGKYFTEASSKDEAEEHFESLWYKNPEAIQHDQFGGLSVVTKTIEGSESIILVTVSGYISLVSSALLKAHFIRLLKSNWKKVCIDFINVTASNSHSHGLYDLMKINQEYEKNGAMIALCIGSSLAVHNWFEVSGLDHFLHCFDELEKAIQYISNNQQAKKNIVHLLSERDDANETSRLLYSLNGFDELYDPQYHLEFKLDKAINIDSCLILYPKGYIDSSNIGYFRKYIDTANNNGYIRLILSWKDIPTTRAPSVWKEIVEIQTKLKSVGGNIVLIDLTEGVLEVVKNIGLINVINIFSTMDEADVFLNQ